MPTLWCFAAYGCADTMRNINFGDERRMVDNDQRVLDNALRTLLGGARVVLERQTSLVERLESDLAAARRELEYQQRLVDILQIESLRRGPGTTSAGAESSVVGPAHAAPEASKGRGTSEVGPMRLRSQDAELLRGSTRLECALHELRTTGLIRPGGSDAPISADLSGEADIEGIEGIDCFVPTGGAAFAPGTDAIPVHHSHEKKNTWSPRRGTA
jgi:hypothetical protein